MVSHLQVESLTIVKDEKGKLKVLSIFNQVTTKLSHLTPSGNNAAVGMVHVLALLRDCGLGEERQLPSSTE